jgi:hypothetical protein
MIRTQVGLFLLLAAAIWEALNHWSLLDSVITKLRSEGPTGTFMADLMVSPLLRLVLIIGGLGFVVKGYLETRKTKARATPVEIDELSSRYPVPPALVPPAPAPAPAAPLSADQATSGRIFVNATPEYLSGLFKGQTVIQANTLLAVYIGKWMRLDGEVNDVLSRRGDRVQVMFIKAGSPITFMRFHTEAWVDRVAVLRPGDRITVIGQIEEASSTQLQLDFCELV